jgi:hypothetical protein
VQISHDLKGTGTSDVSQNECRHAQIIPNCNSKLKLIFVDEIISMIKKNFVERHHSHAESVKALAFIEFLKIAIRLQTLHVWPT